MRQIKFKKAFTLIELILVIFLISIMMYFVFSTPSVPKAQKELITYKNLPQYLQKTLPLDGELVCTNKCTKCFYLNGTANAQKVSLPIPLHVKNEYILDSSNNADKIDLGRYNDKKVCLRLNHYKNGSISQVIFELDDKFLFIPSYFGEGKIFESLSDAVSYWTKDSQNNLRSKGDWY